jgi:hypothetical protein
MPSQVDQAVLPVSSPQAAAHNYQNQEAPSVVLQIHDADRQQQVVH